MENYLIHHGILGQKWGVRRYQNKDGSLTSAGRTRYGIEQLEKKAIKEEYKRQIKNGGSHISKFYRTSTGDNYKKAEDAFQKKMEKDEEYKALSKKAFDAEKKRLLYEKKFLGDPDTDEYYDNYDKNYDKMVKSKEYQKLENDSIAATKAKDDRVKKVAKEYVDVIKEAKIKDLKISDKDKEFAKQYISDRFYDHYYDLNLEYNIDHFYEKWVDNEKFK